MISPITEMEIFGNPDDLEFTLGQNGEGGKFAFGILRGRGHRYKPLVSSKPVFGTADEAVDCFRAILDHIYKTYALPPEQAADEPHTLNQKLIDQIINGLREHGKFSTFPSPEQAQSV